jgi:hypothetical protein
VSIRIRRHPGGLRYFCAVPSGSLPAPHPAGVTSRTAVPRLPMAHQIEPSRLCHNNGAGNPPLAPQAPTGPPAAAPRSRHDCPAGTLADHPTHDPA